MVPESRLEELLGELTTAEKVALCHAGSKFSVPGVPRLGIPEFTMSDGPHGVRRELVRDGWDPLDCDWDYATYLPTGTALAATWSTDCGTLFGTVLGEEARARGKDIILGPGVNLLRTPLCGRNFEYLSEDPVLAGVLAAGTVRAIQRQGVAACVKHYALNSQELNRNGVDAQCDERTLRELYLAAFERVVRDGGVWSLMGAYNRFRGQHCCQNDYLLNQILKKEWGFDGVVISDWAGVHDTFEAARGGMDLEMGTGTDYEAYYLGRPFREAVERGEIEVAVLDDKVRRILRLLNRVGQLDGTVKRGALNTPEHQAAARSIAEEAMVLLKNEGALLPLDRTRLRRVLVVGDNAVTRHHAGGNSSAVKALYEVTPLEGLQKLLGDAVAIEFLRGYPDFSAEGTPFPGEWLDIVDSGAGTGGWLAEYFDNRDFAGEPCRSVPLADAELIFSEEELDRISVRVRARFTPRRDWVGTLVLDDCRQGWFAVDGEVVVMSSPEVTRSGMDYTFRAGRSYELKLELQPRRVEGTARVRIRFAERSAEAPAGREAVLAAARRADVVLFFGGLNHFYDVEGADRKDMALHDGQNELIAVLAEVNPRLVVALVGGTPMELPWLDQVPAVVQMWYAGMEAGTAIARLLFGEVNFSGHLPFTFPKRLADSPAHFLDDYHAEACFYREGVFMGYRWFEARGIEPLFPFGHGLSYTSFQFGGLEAVKTGAFSCRVTARAKNTGSCSGKAVLQLYVADPDNPTPRPPKELRAFAKVDLQPGEERTVVWDLGVRDFACFDSVKREFVARPGRFELLLGSSSALIEDRTAVEFAGEL